MQKIIDDVAKTSFMGNNILEWGTALFVTAGIFILIFLIRGIVLRHHAKGTYQNRWPWAGYILSALSQTKLLFIIVIALLSGTASLALPTKALLYVQNTSILLVFAQIGLWIDGLYRAWYAAYYERHVTSSPSTATALGATRVAISAGIWICVLLLALDNVGVNVTALVTGLGIGGIAIALAVQSTLGDLLASLSIVLDKPFIVGDYLVIDQYMGTVENIGLKTTRLRSLSGEQLILSNANILKSNIRNYGRMYRRRVLNTIRVTYQTPIEKLQAIPGMVRDIVLSQQNVTFDRVHFKNFGDFSLDFEYVFFVNTADYNIYMDIQQNINLTLMRLFAEHKIEFAYPTQTLLVEKSAA